MKRSGDDAEREAETMLRGLGFPDARRKLGAGRKDDQGDIDGVPGWTVQVTRCATDQSVASRLATKLRDVQVQASRSGHARGVVLIRLAGRGSTPVVWRAVLPLGPWESTCQYGGMLLAPVAMPVGVAVRWLPDYVPSMACRLWGDGDGDGDGGLVLTVAGWAALARNSQSGGSE